MIDDIIYLKKACRLGYESHGLDIPRLNQIISTLQEKAEKYDKMNHVIDTGSEQIIKDANKVVDLIQENKKLKKQIQRELDDNNGLRETTTRQFHEIEKLKEKIGILLAESHKQQILRNQEIVERLKNWLQESLEPVPEGHLPIVSLNGVTLKIKEVLGQQS